jgi:hypothetical protein
MMGMPTTWFFLSLLHLFWIDEAVRVGSRGLSQSLHRNLKYRAAVCGDDLVAHWPNAIVREYDNVVLKSGGKFSAGKHFVTSNGRGVFTEKIFHLRVRTFKEWVHKGTPEKGFANPLPGEIGSGSFQRTGGVSWSGNLPLKSLSKPSTNGTVPTWYALGSICEALLTEAPDRDVCLRKGKRVIHILYPKLL